MQRPVARRAPLCDNAAVIGQLIQDPATSPIPANPEPWYHALQNLGWVDITALSVIAVFFVLGLFKGFVWQVSRVAILLVAYFVAGHYGSLLGEKVAQLLYNPPIRTEQSDLSVYLAYVAIFLAVLILLSLLALLLQKLVKKADMTFFDRLGGGVIGIVTGAAVVLFLLLATQMFFQGSGMARDAAASQSNQLSSRAVTLFGQVVPDEVRKVFGLDPLLQPQPKNGEAETPPKGH